MRTSRTRVAIGRDLAGAATWIFAQHIAASPNSPSLLSRDADHASEFADNPCFALYRFAVPPLAGQPISCFFQTTACPTSAREWGQRTGYISPSLHH
jgi:hypothetical protein